MLERPKEKRKYKIVGGKIIFGKIFEYQTKTSMPYNDIMKLPYIAFILGMLDAPQVDYDSEKEDIKKPQTKEEEIAVMNAIFN